jgi:probable rRNA maturation factor
MSSEGSSICFERCPRSLDRKRLRVFHHRLQEEVSSAAFNCLITHDDDLREWNRQFLKKDYATDVLSFPSAEPNGLIGDIAISVERAEEQASKFGHTVEAEIEILMLHGALHLMGMDHETDKGRMARAESAWRKKLGLPTSLITRSRRKG